jgi:lipase chaperone LimK
MASRRTLAGASLLGLALLGAGWWLWPPGPGEGPADGAASGTAPGGAFVRSMEGTAPDGDLLSALAAPGTGATAGALPYAELKRLFDYYLSAVGEQSIETIAQQIRTVLDQRLSPAQAPAAKRLLGQYLAFKRELVTLEKELGAGPTGVQALRKRFVAMQDLRARFFNAAEEQGLFGFEDMYDADALARLEIDQNPALSAAQKREQLAALDAAMPAALRADREAPRVVLRAEQKAQEMRANGASEDDIFRMRAKAFDPAAASRLADLDREEAAWKNRIASYLSERSKVLKATANAPESERQAALSQLQQAQFSAEERPRLAAYE